jgi:hypothetical protein
MSAAGAKGMHVGGEIGVKHADVRLRRHVRPSVADVRPHIAEFGAHLAQKLEDEARGFFGRRVILTPSVTGDSLLYARPWVWERQRRRTRGGAGGDIPT